LLAYCPMELGYYPFYLTNEEIDAPRIYMLCQKVI